MKKIIYTIAFAGLTTIHAQAQSTNNNSAKQDNAQPAKTSPGASVTPGNNEAKSDKPAKEEAPKSGGTRMAITEKGLPAAKGKSKATKSTDSK